jgi:hypothetical protein
MRKENPELFPQVLKTCGKKVFGSFLQASGITPAPERFLCPCRSARGLFGVAGPGTAAMRQRGIVAD